MGTEGQGVSPGHVQRVLESSPPEIAVVDSIAALPDAELISRYRWGVEHFDRRLVRLDEELLDTAFLPDAGVGRWPVRGVVGHLAEAEIANTQRIRRALAEESPVVGAWDPDAYLDAGLYGSSMPVGGFVAVIYTLRVWMGELLGTLSEDQWSRPLLHESRGPFTVRRMAAFNVWHLERHAWFINAKIEKMLGAIADMPAESASEPCCDGDGAGKPAAGCGLGCACAAERGERE